MKQQPPRHDLCRGFFFENFLYYIKPFSFSNLLIDKNKEPQGKRKDENDELDLFCDRRVDCDTGGDLPDSTVYGNRWLGPWGIGYLASVCRKTFGSNRGGLAGADLYRVRVRNSHGIN